MFCLCSATRDVQSSSSETRKSIPSSKAKSVKLPDTMKTTYQIAEVCGSGEFSTVYRVTTKDNYSFALKVVESKKQKSRSREAELLKELNCENCVHMYTCQEKDRSLFIIMDYIPLTLNDYNESLRAKAEKPSLLMVKLFAYQIFYGLAYLHKRGIAHRDICPENILIKERSGVLKLADFGSAKTVDPEASNSFDVGSLRYRAPEILYESPKYGCAVDIWSAGCVIAEMLLLRPLFGGQNANQQLTELVKILGHPSDDDFACVESSAIIVTAKRTSTLKKEMPAWTPPDVVDLLEKVLVYNPEKRLTAEECLTHSAFDELFSGKKAKMTNGHSIPKLTRTVEGVQSEQS